MIRLGWTSPHGRPLRILCLGAHCDDIEIGCGGTVLALLAREAVHVTWMVLCSSPTRAAEARGAAARFLAKAQTSEVDIRDFRDGFLPYTGGQVKEVFEDLKGRTDPDLILTHYRHDLHQDHRLVSELTWNTFRDHLILEYEIPKWDGDLGSPNLFVPLEAEECETKIGAILEGFPSQRGRAWFTRDLFFSLLRLRGMECHSPSQYAEAFYCRKAILT